MKNKVSIADFLENIAQRNQGFWTDEVLKNTHLGDKMEKFATENFDNFSCGVVLGIGGSALGIRVLLESGLTQNDKKLHVVDTVDPFFLESVFSSLEWEKTLFFVITKSGGTVETLSQYFAVKNILEKKNLSLQKHLVCITDETEGFLRTEVEKYQLSAFPVPKTVGGRFSVLTAVGLLPALFVGISPQKLLDGAVEMQKKFLSTNVAENVPFTLAEKIFSAYESGKKNLVFYVYSTQLFRFSDWLRQLLAESTGKKFSSDGKEIFAGITPIPAMGVTDHHSQNQLYLEGPNDKFFVFLTVQNWKKTVPLPKITEEKFLYLSEKTFADLFVAEQKACMKTLEEANRDFLECVVPEISVEEMGKMFFLWEAVVAFLGEMMNIDAFDQPAVERTKVITKEILENNEI